MKQKRVYKHVRSTKQKHPEGHPSSSFSASGSSFLVLDVLVMDTEEASASGAGVVDKRKAEEEARKVQEEERERHLIKTYLPMVGDFIEGERRGQGQGQGSKGSSQRKMPSSSRRVDKKEDTAREMESQYVSGSTAQPMDFVYDVYLPAPPMDLEDGSGAPDDHDESTPVVDVEEDEMWYDDPVEDGSDAGKSEDSNAESYYANSYPDEEEEEEWGKEGEDEDGEMGGGHEVTPGQDLRRVYGMFGAEEYDLTRDTDEEEEEEEKVSWRSKLMR